MFDQLYRDEKEKEQAKAELMGLMGLEQSIHKAWSIRFKMFDFSKEEDITELEEIFTKSTEKSNNESGVTILYENARFFDDGTFKMVLRWGIWNAKK